MAGFLDKYFKISERNSDIGTEIRAGTASFFTLSYLLLVNPQIMVMAGVAQSDAVTYSTYVSDLHVMLGRLQYASAKLALNMTAPPEAIVPISGKEGKGMRILKQALDAALATANDEPSP